MSARTSPALDRVAACVATFVVAVVALVSVGAAPAFAGAAPGLIPFGSLSALQHAMATGQIVGSVSLETFIVEQHDDMDKVSYQVAALKRHAPTRPLVILVGGSGVRECVSSDTILAQDIAAQCHVKVRVLTLASSNQRVCSALAIIDNLPARHYGVVVIGVHAPAFASTADDAKTQLTGVPLLMTSRALHDFVLARFGYDPPNTMIPGLQSFLDTYQADRGAPAFEGAAIAYKRHRYADVLSLDDKLAAVSQFCNGAGAPGGSFYTNLSLNGSLLRHSVALARSKGYRVLIMDEPEDTAAIGNAFDVYKQKYQAICRKAAADFGARYVDLNGTVPLTSGDFHDLYHLVQTGYVQWTPALAGVIAQIIHDHPPKGDSVTRH